MANPIIYPGSSSFFPGNTPFGFFDNDYQFQIDADKVALFCARRLGFPIIDVELIDLNFYTAFEEAVTTYGNTIYSYKIKQDYLDVEGSSRDVNLNNTLVTPNMGTIIRISEQYGNEAGVGGNVSWRTGSIDLISDVQNYDLNVWALDNGITEGDLEIKKIFFEGSPALTKYFDPYATTGTGQMNMLDNFGFSSFAPAINFMLMPLSHDVQTLQSIEMNDTIRKSNFSFELVNNQLRLFPIPNGAVGKLFFKYILKSERFSNNITPTTSSITNISNVPYANPIYSQINAVGRSWIFEYTLALCKEMLGYVRGKYDSIPIPNSEIKMNQADLISAATAEKTALVEKLKLYLDEMSRDKLLERRSNENDYRMKELSSVPNVIYLG
jgi:hypothetical protein